MSTYRLSNQGLEIAEQARQAKRWKRQDEKLARAALVSVATLKRFWGQQPIRADSFEHVCRALGLEDWQRLVEVEEERSLDFPQFAWDEFWVGREKLVVQLSERLQNSCRVLMLAGMTGIGKTALAEKLVLELQPLPSFSRINLDHREKTVEFSAIATQLLEGWKQQISDSDRRDPQRLLNWLVSYLQQNPCFLLIDSLENVLRGSEQTGWSEFIDPLWVQFFQKLLAVETCASTVLLTSQDSPAQLVELGQRYSHLYQCCVLDGLTPEEQMSLFRQIGLLVEDPVVCDYLSRIGCAYEGHPLALRVIAGEISQAPFDGDVQAYWKRYGDEIERVKQLQQTAEIEGPHDALKLAQYSRNLRQRVRQRIDRTLRRLTEEVPLAYVVLCFGAVYRRPVPERFWLRSLEGRSLDENQQLAVLDALYDRYLAEQVVMDGDLMIRQHNLIRSIALDHLKNLQP